MVDAMRARRTAPRIVATIAHDNTGHHDVSMMSGTDVTLLHMRRVQASCEPSHDVCGVGARWFASGHSSQPRADHERELLRVWQRRGMCHRRTPSLRALML